MSTVDLIQSIIKEKWYDLDQNEQAIIRLLHERWNERKQTTQAQIARAVLGLGHHERHEDGLPTKKNESTLRKVRQIIRDIRVNHGIPILSDSCGYWLPYNIEECQTFIAKMERTAKAHMAARYETYRAVERSLGLRSDFFEAQTNLFERDTKPHNQ